MATPIQQGEIVPGLVVHQETDVLRKLGNSYSNVDTSNGASPVHGPHYFMVLSTDASTGLVLAVPLFSHNTDGGVHLYDNEKGGPSQGWSGQGEDSWFSKYQHWKIPPADMIAASLNDGGTVGVRRHYGVKTPSVRDYIEQSQSQNRKKTFDPVK